MYIFFVKIITVIVTTFENVYNCLLKLLAFKHHPKVFIKLIIQQKIDQFATFFSPIFNIILTLIKKH